MEETNEIIQSNLSLSDEIIPKQTGVYEFSVPLPFDFETIDKIVEINSRLKKSQITSFYNNTPLPFADKFNQWVQVNRGKNDRIQSYDDFRKYVKYATDRGFSFTYLMNSPEFSTATFTFSCPHPRGSSFIASVLMVVQSHSGIKVMEMDSDLLFLKVNEALTESPTLASPTSTVECRTEKVPSALLHPAKTNKPASHAIIRISVLIVLFINSICLICIVSDSLSCYDSNNEIIGYKSPVTGIV